MAREELSRVLELAEMISDDTAVDWQAEESDHPKLASFIGRLQRVERVAAGFRGLQGPRGEDARDNGALFTWGHLQAREKLGEGAFAEVFRAYDPLLQRDVALKLRRQGPSHAGGGRSFASNEDSVQVEGFALVGEFERPT